MRRRFYQEVLYDYTSEAEARRHCKEMCSKGWRAWNPTTERVEAEPVYCFEPNAEKGDYAWSCWYRWEY